MMRATILEVGPVLTGKKFNIGYRIVKFAMEDGSFAMCYIGEDFRNWHRWGPLQVGKTYGNAKMLKAGIINADSVVVLDSGPPCKYVSVAKKKAPKVKQGELFA